MNGSGSNERSAGNALFETIENTTSEVILFAGLDGAVKYISPGCLQLAGYTPAELTDALGLDLVHPQDRAHLMETLQGIANQDGRPIYRILHKDGRYVWIESTVNLLRDPVTAEPAGVVAMSRDVTARKRAEENAAVVEAAPSALIMVGADGKIALVNAQTEKLFGYERDELLGMHIEMLMPKRFRTAHDAHRKAFFAAPSARAMGAGRDLGGVRKDGSEIQLEIGLNPVSTPEGQFVLASIIDITARKEAEQRAQLLMTAVLEGVQDYGIYLLDPDGYVLNWNEGAARIKGYKESEIVGQHFSRFYTPEDVQAGKPETALCRAREEGRFTDDGWRVRRDGSRFWAVITLTALLDKSGKLRGFLKLTRDITERMQAQERLRESEQNLRLMADAMPQIVWTADPEGTRDYYNRRWYEFTGTPEGQDGDLIWESIVHPADIQQRHSTWREAVASGQPYEAQFRIRDRKSGDYRWYLARAVALRDKDHRITRWVGTLTDIDDHKRLNEQLEQRVGERTAELQRSLMEKTTLLKEVHHRVKNNLQVVCSLLSMQIDSVESPALAEPLTNAYSRVLAMSLIHEQLYATESLADLDFGGYVQLLADRLFSAYCVEPDRIRLELSVEALQINLHRAIPCGLILNELLSNSLKHAFRDGRQGVIRVSLRKTESGRVELAVADNGPGFPAGFNWEEGRSLGLRVVRALIQQLRADVDVAAPDGAMFRFTWDAPDVSTLVAEVGVEQDTPTETKQVIDFQQRQKRQ